MTVVKELQSRQQLIDLGRLVRDEYHPECAPKHVPFDMEALYLNGDRILKDPERKFQNVWLAYDGPKLIGFLFASCVSYVFNFERTARMENLYVIPERRGTATAFRLIRQFEEWARLHGAIQVFLGVDRDDRAEARRIGRMFPRIGYNFVGTYYVKNTGA